MVGQSTRLREEAHPRLGLDTANRMSKAILGLLESSLIPNSPDLHAEMLRFLTSAETDYPIRGLVHLLRTAHETRARDALRGLQSLTRQASLLQGPAAVAPRLQTIYIDR